MMPDALRADRTVTGAATPGIARKQALKKRVLIILNATWNQLCVSSSNAIRSIRNVRSARRVWQ